MKAIIKKDLFASKLSKITKFAGDGKAIPIYANVLLKVKEGNEMEMVCGDGNTYISDSYSLMNTVEPGEVTVNAKDFSKLVDSLSSKEELELNLIDNKLHVKSGRSEFKLSTIPSAQYPEVPVELTGEGTVSYEVQLKELQTALKCSKVCVAKDMTNPYLTGYKVGGELFTSDVLKICIYNNKFAETDILVSGVCAEALLYADGEEKVEIFKRANQVLIKGEDFRVVSSVVDGVEKFPVSTPFVEQKLEHSVKLNRQVLIPILKRACIFTVADLSNAVKLDFKKNLLEIRSFNNKDSGASSEPVDIQYDGDEVSLLLDGMDFVDVMDSLISDDFILQFEKDALNIKIEQDKLIYILCLLEFNEEGK